MPTVSQLQEKATEMNIKFKKSDKKAKLIELLGPKNVSELDFAKRPVDIGDLKGFIYKGKIYNKLSTHKTDKFIVHTLLRFKDILIVKGELGKGLGLGGGIWRYTMHRIVSSSDETGKDEKHEKAKSR